MPALGTELNPCCSERTWTVLCDNPCSECFHTHNDHGTQEDYDGPCRLECACSGYIRYREMNHAEAVQRVHELEKRLAESEYKRRDLERSRPKI